MYLEPPGSLIFCFILSLFLVNGPQALHIIPGCLHCICSINLSPANKKAFTIAFILYIEYKVSTKGISP